MGMGDGSCAEKKEHVETPGKGVIVQYSGTRIHRAEDRLSNKYKKTITEKRFSVIFPVILENGKVILNTL